MDDGRRRRQSLQTYDLGIGFFGFFAVAFVAISLFFQIAGRDAVWASLPALLCIGIALVIFFFRRRYARRPFVGGDEDD